MPGQAIGRGTGLIQGLRDLPVQFARNGLRHGTQCGLENQVMRKSAVAQDLRGFELDPGIGQVEQSNLQHRGREARAEILSGHGSATQQSHSHG